MNHPNQITSHVQVRNAAFTSGNSTAIDTLNFGNILFIVNFAAAGAAAVKLQSSSDGSTGWTDINPGYLTSAAYPYPTAGNNTGATITLAASGTTTATNQFVAVSLNRPQPNMRYIRAVATTGTPAYGVALLSKPELSAPAQPDFGFAEAKGTF